MTNQHTLLIVTLCFIYQVRHSSHLFNLTDVSSLLYTVGQVKLIGPLWSTSAFIFESAIGKLSRMVRGPSLPIDQLCDRFFFTKVNVMIMTVTTFLNHWDTSLILMKQQG